MRWFAILLFAAGVVSGTANAEPRRWVVDKELSSLAIVYLIDGKERRGSFAEFSGEAVFDPDDPGAAELEFLIRTPTIDAGDSFGTEVVRGGDWLDVETHPTARFILTKLRPLGDDRYGITGDLTLRGSTGVVSGEMTLRIGASEAKAAGRSVFDRREYGVGVGFTTLFVEVGDEIAVAFDLTASPAE